MGVVLDILVTAAVLITAIAGCANSDTEETDISPSDISVSDVSETEVTTTETSETTKVSETQYEPDPTYEEAAAYVKQLLAEGNTPEEVIDILVSEGRTEFDATALVNSVLLEDEGTTGGGGTSTSSGTTSGSGNGSSGGGSSSSNGNTDSGSSGTSLGSGTTSGSGNGSSGSGTETTPAATQATSSGSTTTTTAATSTTESSASPTPTQVPTKVIQTCYLEIIWSDDTLEAATALGVDLNAERPTEVGIAVYACDANGNYNAGSVIDRSDYDAAEAQLYADADAILAKYGITNGAYSYSGYYENEYVYD